MSADDLHPLLLRETAEIAFTEMKRFLEPRLADDFNLRRVTAPLCLAAGSGLAGPEPHVRFRETNGTEMEIVSGLDRWLRSQLERYDSAPGFGVFSVMNAVRPEIPESAISSPHVSSWAWQQVLTDEQTIGRKTITETAEKVFNILRDTEKMILEKFPHLSAVITEDMTVVGESEITSAHPSHDFTYSRHAYHRRQKDCALFVVADTSLSGQAPMSGTLSVWNEMLPVSLPVAEITLYPADSLTSLDSVGGNIWRDSLALHILHQTEMLK